jgi:serine/threonine-protein kinase
MMATVAASRTERPTLEAGHRVGGRFEVQRLLGRGGMGEVYAAVNSKTGRHVALKIVRSNVADPEHRRRFLREAKATTAISHPNVVEVFDVFEEQDGSPIMVMELLEGEPLSSLLERSGKLSLAAAAAIFLPVARALTLAHGKGIVHRDLKPDNVFLAASSATPGQIVPKVLDFGIAKVLDPTAIAAETQGLPTNTGSILGTPQYMSYEQAMSEKDIDARADIWTLGVMLFEALAGRRPLVFENLGQMYTQLLQAPIPSLREGAPEVPESLCDLVDACLRKNRNERLSELAPLIAELERYAPADVSLSQILSQEPVAAASIPWQSVSAEHGAPTAGLGDSASAGGRELSSVRTPTPSAFVATRGAGKSRLPSRRTIALTAALTVIAAGVGFGLTFQNSEGDGATKSTALGDEPRGDAAEPSAVVTPPPPADPAPAAPPGSDARGDEVPPKPPPKGVGPKTPQPPPQPPPAPSAAPSPSASSRTTVIEGLPY